MPAQFKHELGTVLMIVAAILAYVCVLGWFFVGRRNSAGEFFAAIVTSLFLVGMWLSLS